MKISYKEMVRIMNYPDVDTTSPLLQDFKPHDRFILVVGPSENIVAFVDVASLFHRVINKGRSKEKSAWTLYVAQNHPALTDRQRQALYSDCPAFAGEPECLIKPD